MAPTRYDVLGIGNAIVDVIARADEDFLVGHGMHKGAMALIDEARAEAIYDAMGPAIEVSGGSAANTTVGSQVSGRARPSSARSRTTSSAAPSPTISAPQASPSTHRRRPTVPRLRAVMCW